MICFGDYQKYSIYLGIKIHGMSLIENMVFCDTVQNDKDFFNVIENDPM